MLQTILSIISVTIAAVGMAENAKEFVNSGSEIYQGNIPEGAKKYE
jgi:hypothetical protein